MAIKEIQVTEYKCWCEKCEHEWITNGGELPKACAKCKSKSWNKSGSGKELKLQTLPKASAEDGPVLFTEKGERIWAPPAKPILYLKPGEDRYSKIVEEIANKYPDLMSKEIIEAWAQKEIPPEGNRKIRRAQQAVQDMRYAEGQETAPYEEFEINEAEINEAEINETEEQE